MPDAHSHVPASERQATAAAWHRERAQEEKVLVGHPEMTTAFQNTINKVRSAAGFRMSTLFPAQLCNFIYSRTIS